MKGFEKPVGQNEPFHLEWMIPTEGKFPETVGIDES
jgi:hypothetical protein